MKNKEWAKVARLYNGPRYAANAYDTKMQNEYNNLKRRSG